jgi:two-component system, LuxR family, response regulator FixJ
MRLASFNTRGAHNKTQNASLGGPGVPFFSPGSVNMAPVPDSSAEAKQVAICVVASDPVEREALARLLARLKHEVCSFASAEALLEVLAHTRMTVLVASLELPGMSGVELLHEVRRRDRQVPAILLAGESDVATAVEAIRAGAVDFIQKPVIDRILLRRVTDALARVSA